MGAALGTMEDLRLSNSLQRPTPVGTTSARLSPWKQVRLSTLTLCYILQVGRYADWNTIWRVLPFNEPTLVYIRLTHFHCASR
jgi:hypothetical protein